MVQLCSSDIFSSPTFDKNRITVEAAAQQQVTSLWPLLCLSGLSQELDPIMDLVGSRFLKFMKDKHSCSMKMCMLRFWISSKMRIEHHKTIKPIIRNADHLIYPAEGKVPL